VYGRVVDADKVFQVVEFVERSTFQEEIAGLLIYVTVPTVTFAEVVLVADTPGVVIGDVM
jgi:hypothetical protein